MGICGKGHMSQSKRRLLGAPIVERFRAIEYVGARGAHIYKRFLILLNEKFKHIVINALAGADLYCIVDACSVDGWVFVEKVT